MKKKCTTCQFHELFDGEDYCLVTGSRNKSNFPPECGSWEPYLTVELYQKDVERTLLDQNPREMLLNGALGCCAEAGEAANFVKKYYYQKKHKLETMEIIYELGDQLFYIVQSAKALGFDLSDVMYHNITKRKIRYPI